MMGPNAKRIAEELCPQALEALKSGGSWEYKPEAADSGDAWAFESSPQVWQQRYIVPGYTVEDGRVYHDFWECVDGDWTFLDARDVDDPNLAAWLDGYSEEKRQEGWLKYAEFVQANGIDPLRGYSVERTRKESWMARFAQDEFGVLFVGAHKRSIAFVQRVAETNPDRLPKEVLEYLQLKSGVNRFLYVNGIQTLAEIKCPEVVVTRNHAVVTFDVEMPLADSTIKYNLIQAAARHIESAS
jgi:hypothetical protein